MAPGKVQAHETAPPKAHETVPPKAHETVPPKAHETVPPKAHETAPPAETTPPVAYISGHIDLDWDTFLKKYQSRLDEAIAAGHWFVIGNAKGCDAMALRYLKERGVAYDRVLVYFFAHPKDRKQLSKTQLEGYPWTDGFKSYTQRDACCTNDSTYDILHVRPAEETARICATMGIRFDPRRISGTERNRLRRATPL